jgi:diguanylate cyclase (GGDEF)-like protein
MRVPAESRLIVAFVAAATALIVAASFALASARAYIEAQDRIAAMLAPNVLAELSSTTLDAPRDEASAAKSRRVAALEDDLRAARAAAARHLDAAARATVMAGLLATGFFCALYAALLRTLRSKARLDERLGTEANHDPLTGLPNRRFFAEWLSYAIAHARRERGRVGVLFIDINGCGAVAEFHGERAAEALLVEIARRFRAASREGDLFARLGPTEFALATPNAPDTRQLALLAQRLRDQLNESSQPPLADMPIGASIGIAFYPEDANDSAGIMAAANAAMYAARRAGRNHVAFNALAA